MTRRQHDPDAWLRRGEELLERALDVLSKRLETADEASLPELSRAIHDVAGMVTTHRALIPTTIDGPPRRTRRKRTEGAM